MFKTRFGVFNDSPSVSFALCRYIIITTPIIFAFINKSKPRQYFSIIRSLSQVTQCTGNVVLINFCTDDSHLRSVKFTPWLKVRWGRNNESGGREKGGMEDRVRERRGEKEGGKEDED